MRVCFNVIGLYLGYTYTNLLYMEVQKVKIVIVGDESLEKSTLMLRFLSLDVDLLNGRKDQTAYQTELSLILV